MESFQDVLQRLASRWEAQGKQHETSEEWKAEFLNLLMRARREWHGLENNTAAANALDQNTIALSERPERLSAEFAVTEGFLRRLSINPTAALEYIEREIERKSAAQSKRASNARPSRHDSITRIINEIVEDNPKVSTKQVGQYLLSTGEIEYDRDQYIHKTDRAAVTERALAGRVSNAKKRLLKKDSR